MPFTYKNKLALILVKTGWSQQTLAKHIGVSEKQMSLWMQEHAKPHTIEFKEKIDQLYFDKVHGQQTMFGVN